MVAGADIVAYAQQQLGKPYVWGAEGPNSFDCSGLVQYVYRHFGLTTPRVTYDMASDPKLQPVTRAQLQPGDLIFSSWDGQKHSHVGIYTGDGRIIEAPEPGKDVMVSTLGPNYWAHADAFRRVPGVDGYNHSAGGPSAANGALAGALATLPGGPGPVGLALAAPGSVTEALGMVGGAMYSIAESASSVGNFANLATKAFLPSNLIRGFSLFTGIICILIGIWFLAREVKSS